MTLSTDNFMSRVLWHVPVKGQHQVRYYGLYRPGAVAKREAIRAQRGETAGENVQPRAKKERTCPQCGGLLRHRSSTRRNIFSVRSERSRSGHGGLSNE